MRSSKFSPFLRSIYLVVLSFTFLFVLISIMVSPLIGFIIDAFTVLFVSRLGNVKLFKILFYYNLASLGISYQYWLSMTAIISTTLGVPYIHGLFLVSTLTIIISVLSATFSLLFWKYVFKNLRVGKLLLCLIEL